MKGVEQNTTSTTTTLHERPFLTNHSFDFEEQLTVVSNTLNEQMLKRPNILLVGETGVGKSSLINKIFNGEDAPTGVGKPITQTISQYPPPNNRESEYSVVLYDSKGLEKGKQGIDSQNKIVSFLSDMSRETDKCKRLHIIWYLVSAASGRWSGGDVEICENLLGDYPVFIVLTKCDLVTDEEVLAMKFAIQMSKPANCHGVFITSSLHNSNTTTSNHNSVIHQYSRSCPSCIHTTNTITTTTNMNTNENQRFNQMNEKITLPIIMSKTRPQTIQCNQCKQVASACINNQCHNAALLYNPSEKEWTCKNCGETWDALNRRFLDFTDDLIESNHKILSDIDSALALSFAHSLKDTDTSYRYRLLASVASILTASSAAAAIAAVPIPFSDSYLLVPTQLSLIASLAVIWQFPILKYKNHVVFMLAKTAIGPVTTFCGSTLTSLLKLLPVVNVIGSGVNAIAASSITAVLGIVYTIAFSKIWKNQIELKQQRQEMRQLRQQQQQQHSTITGEQQLLEEISEEEEQEASVKDVLENVLSIHYFKEIVKNANLGIFTSMTANSVLKVIEKYTTNNNNNTVDTTNKSSSTPTNEKQTVMNQILTTITDNILSSTTNKNNSNQNQQQQQQQQQKVKDEKQIDKRKALEYVHQTRNKLEILFSEYDGLNLSDRIESSDRSDKNVFHEIRQYCNLVMYGNCRRLNLAQPYYEIVSNALSSSTTTTIEEE